MDAGIGKAELPLRIVSADAHAAAPPDAYRDYLEQSYHGYLSDLTDDFAVWRRFWIPRDFTDNAIDAVDEAGAIRSGGRDGGFDIRRRLAELDREGVAAEIVHVSTNSGIPPFFMSMTRPYPPDVRAAGARAYHRWFADMMIDSGGRLFGVANPGPCLDMEETLKEMRWVAEHGFVSISMPGTTADPDLPPLGDRHFDPFWSACEELGLVLSVHVGYGHRQGEIGDFVARAENDPSRRDEEGFTFTALAMDLAREDSPLDLDLDTRRVLWQLMLAGVFDRHETLTLALTEARVDWLPATFAKLDAWLSDEHNHMALKPSEYWRRNCMAGASSIHRSEVELRYEIGVDQLMFGTDYPHLESTWPNTKAWIRDAFGGIPEEETRKILGDNAIRCYGLDADRLSAIAARVGPDPTECLRGEPVRDELISHFHERAGYLRPAETIELTELERTVNEDRALTASLRR